jgi:heme/copper-type cytochrome/quinol oxidase subunit 1
LNLHKCFGGAKSGLLQTVIGNPACSEPLTQRGYDAVDREGEIMLIVLIILLLVFGFGGYRLGPGLGYYGGGGISLIILIVIILLLLRVI